MSNPLALTPINGEPRVHDLHLAERLGFERPLNIRNIIKRNEAKLLSFGILSTAERIHEGAGRPTNEYYLNQKQAIFICMKSETEKAFDVQVEIVHVFDAYLNGESKPTIPNFANPAEAARAWALEYERSQTLQREVEASRPKVMFHDQVVSSESVMDFASMFSLLQRKTGQRFNRPKFLEFCRRHGIACQANQYSGVGTNRFVPRKDYVGTWFVSEMHPNGVTEWMVRPIAIAGIVQLIELDRHSFHPVLKRLGNDSVEVVS
jgi:phage antirepressor YoqD-like protein